MKWDSIFSSEIRQRGQQYYNAGKVKYLQYQDGIYTATVYGSRAYLVKISMQEGKIQAMRCNCPYAQEGKRCKHMAAVLIAIEHQRKNAKLREAKEAKEANRRQADTNDDRLPAHPFEKADWNPENHYYYFDLSAITRDLYVTKGDCRAARQLLLTRNAALKQVEIRYGTESSEKKQYGILKGDITVRGRHHETFLTMDQHEIVDGRCEVPGCPYFYIYKPESYGRQGRSSVCSHLLALLYLAGDYIREYNPGDATDYDGERMLRQHRKIRGKYASVPEAAGVKDRETGQEQLQLEPRLENTEKGLQLSFRIGYGRNYVVKNLTDLVKQVQEREQVAYGKNLTVDFGGSRFSPKSQQYYDFIEKQIQEAQYREQELRQRSRYADNFPDLSVKGQLRLQGARLDEFSAILGEDAVEYVDTAVNRKGRWTLTQREQRPSLSLTIREDLSDGGAFQGIRATGYLPSLWHGQQYDYFIGGYYLNRARKEEMEKYAPLYEAEKEGMVSFRIGRKHLSEFYYSMLPGLRELGKIEEPDAEKILPYLPPEVSFRFYLDAPGQNVTCRLRAVYGEEELPVMELLRSETGEVKETYRDTMREQEAISQVMSYLPYADEEEEYFHCDSEEDRIYEMLAHGVGHLLEWGEVHSTDRFRRLNIRRKPRVTVGISVESDIMNLEISSGDISNEELLELLNSYRQKKKYYRLKNGDFMKIDSEGAEALDQIRETLHMSMKDFLRGKMQVPTYRALYLDQMLKENEALYSDRDSRFRRLVKEFKTVGDGEFPVPETLKETLRSYQAVGYQWLRTLDAYGFGGILADDMGLGKTLQAIAVLLASRQERMAGKDLQAPGRGGDSTEDAAGDTETAATSATSLIVAPASLVYNWQEELRRFAPQLKTGLIVGTQTERREKLRQYREYDVLVTSYDLLKRDIADYEECRFAYQVIDEAQYIKNHSTAAAKAVKVIHSRTRYALTGTPIENRLSEMWSIFDYLMPGFLYGYETFRTEFESPITKSRDEEATGRLRRMVSPFILRRLKQDVLKDLPEKLEETQYARMGEEQQRLYDAQVLHMRQLLEEQTDENYEHNKLQVLAELTRIRQICCDPALFLEDYRGKSAKREACMDRIRSAIEGEHKMLVFSQFTSMLELLEKDLKADRIAYYKITGATAKEQRIDLVRRFNQDDTPVFLISLKAGGTGLNLTGADVVIHYDPWWNQAVQNQATDRAHRIGQTRVVSVYQLIVKDSIEEKIQKMQEAKKNLADEILSGNLGGLGSLSRRELLELIGS